MSGGPRGGLLWVQRIGLVDIERLSTVSNTQCTVLLDHSSPTETGLRGSYLRESRHVTEPFNWVGLRPAAIGYVAPTDH
jgi:hypothetical protein